MKHLLLTTIAAVVLVGCGESQPPKPPTAKAPVISIHKAAYGGNIEAVKQHLAAGADVDARDNVVGVTPLFGAITFGHNEIVELLLANGADVNAKNSFADGGWTPLHQAAWGGHTEAAELLIAKGANVNAKNDDGETPLDGAIEDNHTETANLLRKHGGKTKKKLEAASN